VSWSAGPPTYLQPDRVASKGGRVGLGALLIGYCENDHFGYAGKVGTGFDQELLPGTKQLREEQPSGRQPVVDDIGAGCEEQRGPEP
jgi:ATP-dependent DNA ligase